LETADTELEWLPKDAIRQKYQAYCSKNKLIAEGDKHIHEIMTREMKAWEGQISPEKGERVYVWKGIKLKTI
jgi:hypothetical protein